MQVEEGTTANPVNLLVNSSFENTLNSSLPESWNAGTYNTADDICVSSENQEGSNSFKFTPDQSNTKILYQDLNVKGSEYDTYILSGWLKSARIKPDIEENDDLFSGNMISAEIYYTDGTSCVKPLTMFNECVDDWQFCTDSFSLDDYDDNTQKTPSVIRIVLRSSHQANDCYFDNIQLFKDSVQNYSYDNGNLVSYSEYAQTQSIMEYNDTNDMTKETDAEGNYSTYSYNNHNLTSSDSQTGVSTDYTYNSNGDATGITVNDNSQNDNYEIKTEASYTSDGLFLSQITDEDGNAVSYSFNSNTGNLTSVTDSNGTTNYTYNYNNDLPLSSSKGNVTVNYGYTSGTYRNLTSVNNGYVTYNLGYDKFNNIQSASVGTNQLVTYTYGSNNGSLNRQTYGNGDYIDYSYDEYGSTKEIKQNGQTAFRWETDNSGESSKYIDLITNREYNYNKDSNGRLIGETIKTGSNYLYVPFAKVNYAYDLNNNVSSLINTAGGSKVTVDYDYQLDNLPDTVTINNDKTKSFAYDSLNRLISSTVDLDNDITTSYTYKASDRNTGSSTIYQTNKIETETVGGFNYKYTYDAAGNITGIYRRSAGVYHPLNLYTYDSFNQLTSDTDFANLIKTTYTYDTHGNITSVSKVSIDQNGTPNGTSSSTSYQYTDNTWKYKLTIYNNNTITYDAIGNPLTYRDGMSMTWQNGRELATLAKGNSTMSYTYGADGLRTTKTVDGTVSKYEYVGDQLLFEQRGEKTIHYVYDSFGNVMAAIYKANASDTEHIYYYSHNWRGDVIALYTSTGGIFARYEYDAWGKLLSVKNGYGNIITGPANFALINPIRYRGYYYDTESGLYYLQSRYYDPTTGRFVNADDVGYLGASENNLFSYCTNNPINMVDYNGNIPNWIITGVIHVAITGCWGIIGWIGYYAVKCLLYDAGSIYLYSNGYDLSYYMYHHGMWGYGSELPYSTKNLLISKLKASDIMSNAVKKATKGKTGNRINQSITVEFRRGNKVNTDLYFSVQHIKVGIYGNKSNGRWNLKITVSDTYDFTELRLIHGFSLGNFANDLGWAMQKLGMMVPYRVYVSYNMVV